MAAFVCAMYCWLFIALAGVLPIVWAQESDGGICDPSDLEFHCFLKVSGSFSVHWTVREDQGEIDFAIQAQTSGFAAVGFSRSGEMVDTDAVIGLGGVNGVKPYELTERTTNGVLEDNSQIITSTFSLHVDGQTTFYFTRAYNNGGQSVISLRKMTDMVWAFSDEDSDNVAYHGDNRGAFGIHFGTGETVVHNNGVGAMYTHGFLMWLSFGVMFPGAGLVARYLKYLGEKWFKLHQVLAWSGLLVASIGGIVGSEDVQRGRASNHGNFGVFLLFAAGAQVLLGLCRPTPETPGRRTMWKFLHQNTGRFLVAFGFLNMFMGLGLASDRFGWVTGLKLLLVQILLCLSVAAVVGVYFTLRGTRRRFTKLGQDGDSFGSGTGPAVVGAGFGGGEEMVEEMVVVGTPNSTGNGTGNGAVAGDLLNFDEEEEEEEDAVEVTL